MNVYQIFFFSIINLLEGIAPLTEALSRRRIAHHEDKKEEEEEEEEGGWSDDDDNNNNNNNNNNNINNNIIKVELRLSTSEAGVEYCKSHESAVTSAIKSCLGGTVDVSTIKVSTSVLENYFKLLHLIFFFFFRSPSPTLSPTLPSKSKQHHNEILHAQSTTVNSSAYWATLTIKWLCRS